MLKNLKLKIQQRVPARIYLQFTFTTLGCNIFAWNPKYFSKPWKYYTIELEILTAQKYLGFQAKNFTQICEYKLKVNLR